MNITNNTQSYNVQAPKYPKPEVPVNLEDVKEKMQEVQEEQNVKEQQHQEAKLQKTKQKDVIMEHLKEESQDTNLLEYQRVQEQVLKQKGIEEYQKNILL